MLSKTKKVFTTHLTVLCSIASYKLFYRITWRVETLSLLFVPPTERRRNGDYYVLCTLRKIQKVIHNEKYSAKRIAIKYMKEYMSIDEKRLLIEHFYDGNDNVFNMTGYIEINDGRKAALEKIGIIYRSSNVSYYTMFSYNLQPYVLEYLNQNLILGKIDIQGTKENYRFKFDLV